MSFVSTIPTAEEGVLLMAQSHDECRATNNNNKKKRKLSDSTHRVQSSFNDSVVQRLRSVELLKRPLAVTVKGLITMYLDRNKVITRITHSQVQDEYVEI
jgi:arsenate reductase-like glutaredoxin family protein